MQVWTQVELGLDLPFNNKFLYMHSVSCRRLQMSPNSLFVDKTAQPRESAACLQSGGALRHGPAAIIGRTRAEVQRTREA